MTTSFPFAIASSSSRRRLAGKRSGAMLVFIAVSMVVFLGFLSLALDVGAGNRERRIAQTAADAGAIGGGQEILRMLPSDPARPDSVRASARNEAVRNGYALSDVTVNYPPATGPHAGNDKYVEVVIAKTIPTIFGSIFNMQSMNVSARAVAGVSSFAMNCLVSNSVQIGATGGGGAGQLSTTNCGVAINSTAPDALFIKNGQFETGTGTTSIAGGWIGNGQAAPDPLPVTGTATVPDPLSYLQMPTVGTCNSPGLITITKDTVLNPGVYCGGLNIQSKTATLNPGTYIFNGGGLTVQTSGVIIGDGVSLVNTADATHPAGVFNFGTGCKATLRAPTTGSLAGILMYEDPALPAGQVNTFACSSDSPPELIGTLYFPTQTLLFNGSNAGSQIQGSIVADNVIVSGKVTIINDTSGNSAVKRLSLVE